MNSLFPRKNWIGLALAAFFPALALPALAEGRCGSGTFLPFYLLCTVAGTGVGLSVSGMALCRGKAGEEPGALLVWVVGHPRKLMAGLLLAGGAVAGGLLLTAGRYDGGYLLFRSYSLAWLLVGLGLLNDWLLLKRGGRDG